MPEPSSGGKRAARRAHAPAQPGRLHRAGTHPGPRQAAAPPDRARRTDLDHPLGTAGRRQDHAGAPDRARHALRVHSLQRRAERHQGNQGRDGRCRAPAPPGPPHHSLRRRNPPLQQGAAGRLPALRGTRRHHPDRRHHGEPVVRSDRGAALALARVRPARAHRAGDRHAAQARAAGGEPARQPTNCWSRSPSTPMATRARRTTRWKPPPPRRPAANSPRRPCRTPCSARCCSTTRAAKSTST